jgi:thiamine biosynthesis lipoprotein
MTNAQKNAIYSVVLVALMVLVYQYRKNSNEKETTPPLASKQVSIQGYTMGSTYNVKYLDDAGRDFSTQIDSILLLFNKSLSTYDTTSEISQFNKKGETIFHLPYFYTVLARSEEIHRLTEGAFDPTILPLIKLWGFNKEKASLERIPTQVQIDSIKKFIGFDKITFDEKGVKKLISEVGLNFNAIAPGYAADIVAAFLREKNIQNYMVDIGGEFVCKGKNAQNEYWKIGIENPIVAEQGGREAQAIVALQDAALATSGNYRNFYWKENRKYPHTISPFTGAPVQHNLLSATVIAKDGMSADAFATAMMVLGKEKAIELAQKEQLQIFLIYADSLGALKTYQSPELKIELLQ